MSNQGTVDQNAVVIVDGHKVDASLIQVYIKANDELEFLKRLEKLTDEQTISLWEIVNKLLESEKKKCAVRLLKYDLAQKNLLGMRAKLAKEADSCFQDMYE